MDQQDYSETYDTRTKRAMDAYIRDLWARSGLDEQGEPLPPGVTGRRSQYTPSTVYSDSLFEDSLQEMYRFGITKRTITNTRGNSVGTL